MSIALYPLPTTTASREGEPLTPAVEDYLKAIYTLQQRGERASTTALCAQLGGLKPGSVSGMLRRLEELGLASHTLYQEARLTPAGERAALALVRKHRLLETFLVQALGYSWDEVHAEAERLEHHISSRLAARLAAWLGNPTHDPHGDPIPSPDGALPSQSDRRLCDLRAGECARLIRVTTQGEAELRYLAELGLVPGATVELVMMAPFDGPVSLRVAGGQHVLSRSFAEAFVVTQPETERN